MDNLFTHAATKQVHPTGREGVCPRCFTFAPLFTSDAFSADFSWCETDAVAITANDMERRRPDYVSNDVTRHGGNG